MRRAGVPGGDGAHAGEWAPAPVVRATPCRGEYDPVIRFRQDNGVPNFNAITAAAIEGGHTNPKGRRNRFPARADRRYT